MLYIYLQKKNIQSIENSTAKTKRQKQSSSVNEVQALQ